MGNQSRRLSLGRRFKTDDGITADALDSPFLLLPFRPNTDPQGARTFITNFYKANAERSPKYTGAALEQELRLTEPIVLCSIMKWCWSRLPNGVVSWPVYEGFKIGEKESKMARDAFSTFIPISAESEAQKNIIFDFFDLIAAVAAHGKMNGLAGRKLSRLAGWWAFEHVEDGNGFEGGYKSWTAAADATSHLFFAYLRSLSPDTNPSMNVIERIPRSLQALLASTEYPPEPPTLMQRSTTRVVMVVDSVSPTPFALLRRAKNFEYRDNDAVLREFAEFEDPIDALTEECKRVLYAISATNQSSLARSRSGPTAKADESWSAFQNVGFSDIDEKALAPKAPKVAASTIRSEPQSRNADHARPTTPSWADFLSSGFADDGTKTSTLLYPPAQVLPPLTNPVQTPLYVKSFSEENLAPGELAAITNVELDDAFWWVWMTSLAGEEPSARKAVFGRCALIETTIQNGRWLIMEEQVKGASPDPLEGAYLAPKKSLFGFTKRGRLGRKRSQSKALKVDEPPARVLSATPSKTSLAPDQHAKIRAAAAALTRKTSTPDHDFTNRRGKNDDANANKANSALASGIVSEAGPAMKFINAYDKNAIRAQYLGDATAGTGAPRVTASSTDLSAQAEKSSISSAIPVAASVTTPPSVEPVVVPEQLPLKPVSPVETPAAVRPVQTYEPTHAPADDVPEQPVSVHEPSSPVSTRSARKPVASPEPPSHRVQDFAQAKPATPVQNAAALAAARAMQSTSPTESQKSATLGKKANAGNGGLKKFFGRKKEVSSSSRGDSLDLIRPVNAIPGSTNTSINRRLSLMRRKEQSSRDSITPTPEPIATDSVVGESPAVPTYVPTHAPTYEPEQEQEHDISRVNTREQEAADREFSRFDQGPMADMPGAMPTEFEHDGPEPEPEHEPEPVSAPEPRKFNTQAARRLVPQVDVPAEYEKPDLSSSRYRHERVASDKDSEMTIEDNREPILTQDRWATIRENAAKRAARAEERQSEDQSTQSRFSQSMRTDEGETSGEESKSIPRRPS